MDSSVLNSGMMAARAGARTRRRGITADTALRLSRLLKTSPQLWMRLQADWDLHQALQREASQASYETLG